MGLFFELWGNMRSQFHVIDKVHGRFEGEIKDEHYVAIGQLITAFASVEIAITSYYRDLVGLPYRVAMEIAGDGRASTLMTTIKRILPLIRNDHLVEGRVTTVLSDIASVKKVRDHVAHRPFAVDGNKMAFFNSFTARNLSGDIAVYTLDDIKECCEFCSSLSAMLDLCQNFTGDPVEFKEVIEFRNKEVESIWQSLQKKPAVLQKVNLQPAQPIRPKSQRLPKLS